MSGKDAVQAFEDSLQAVLEAHRHHAEIMGRAVGLAEAPRSRRTLYNAIKAYRKAETALYHAATGHPLSSGDKA